MKCAPRLPTRLLVLSVLVAACADATPAAQPTAAPQATEAPTAAQAVEMVDWGFTGSVQDMFRTNLAEPFMAAHPGVNITLLGGISEDAIAQIKAAQGNSPIDTMLLGEPRYLQAEREGWILPLTAQDIPNVNEVYPNIQEHCSPQAVAWTIETIGVVYNPDLVPRPESWEDLWKPEYEGKIGMAAPSSNAGFLFLMALTKLFGQGESDTDVIWQKLDELQPFVVGSNPEALGQLLEREEIGLAINWATEAAVTIDKGFNVEFAFPAPGAIAQVGCYAVLNNTAQPDLAKEYVNMALDEQFQTAMSQPPYFFAPVNMNVQVSEESRALIPAPEDYPNLLTIDLETALALREGITERFIRDYGQ